MATLQQMLDAATKTPVAKDGATPPAGLTLQQMLELGKAGKPIPKDTPASDIHGMDVLDSQGNVLESGRYYSRNANADLPPPLPEAKPKHTVGDVMASGAEAGVGSLAGTPVDLAQTAGNAGIWAFNKIREQFSPDPNSLFTKPDPSKRVPYIPALPGGSDYIMKKMEEHGLKPRPTLTEPWQKYLYAATAGAAGTLPTLLIPGAGEVKLGKVLTDTGVGAASGAASEAGQEAAQLIDPSNRGLQTVAGLAAGLLPGAASIAGRTATRPFTPGGQRVIAGNILDKEGRGGAVTPPANLPPGFQPTIGQATNNPGLVRLERTFEQSPDHGPDFQIQQQNNQQALRDNLETLRSGQSSDDASMALNHGLRQYKNAMKAQEAALWQNIDPLNTAAQVTGIYRQRLAAAIAKEPVAYQKLIPSSYAEDLARLPYNANVKELHAILSQMKEDARVAGWAGESNKARAIGNVAKMFEKELTNQMMRANPAVRRRFAAANAVSRSNAQTYKQNPVGNLLAKDGTGAPRVQPTALAGKVLAPGAGQKERWEAFKKAVNNNPQAIATARDWFVNKMMDSIVLGDGTVSPDKLGKFLTANQSLMASDIFSPAQKGLIDRIQNAAKMAQNTAKGGVKGGSDTAAKLLGDKYVDILIGRWTSKAVHAAGMGAGAVAGHFIGAEAGTVGGLYGGFKGAELLSKGMDRLYSIPAEKVRELIKDALLDPALAHDLMQQAKGATSLPKTLARYLLADVSQNQSGVLPAARQAAP